MAWSEEAVVVERARRMALDPWHYWERAGNGREEPAREYFCSYCGGFFGVPHAHLVRPCRERHRDGQCACIDCWVTQDRVDARP